MKNRKVQKTFNLKMEVIKTKAKSALNARNVTVDLILWQRKRKHGDTQKGRETK